MIWSSGSSSVAIAWTPDGSGFFYGRYSPPEEGEELTGTNENQRLYFHKLGDDQQQDMILVLERPDHPKWGFAPAVTDDGRYLMIQNWKGSEPKSQIFCQGSAVSPTRRSKPLITGFDAEYEWVASVDDTLYFVTDNDAPKRRLIAVTAGNTNRDDWREVIAETDDVLESVSLFGETFYATWLKDARGKATRHQINGSLIDEIELPGVGSVVGFGGKQDAEETFFAFTNYITPSSIYRVDLKSDEISLWRRPEVAFDVDQFVTEQIFCKSKDGTTVPIIVTRKKGSQLDGSNRTLLYGYGGFNISITPSFSPATATWVDQGGIYAVANLRGGGEYGREWHEDGMRLKKQNVFNDCIAAAECLIDKRYTTPSAACADEDAATGDLLVGAVMTQRPDLFGACLPAGRSDGHAALSQVHHRLGVGDRVRQQ